MAKNLGRGNKGSRKNSVPNVVGVAKTTAETNLTNAGFVYNTTNENTANAGENNTIKSQSVAAGEVQAIGTNVNLVNYTFSFTPFGAFGFTPFGAFGFTPFGAFGFTPFGFTPFGFTPFGFTPFGFTPVFSFTPNTSFLFTPPNCVDEDTLISTPDGLVAAKDLQVGDTVYTVSLQEIPLGDETGENDFNYMGFVSETLTPIEKTTTRIVSIFPSARDRVLGFNEEEDKLFSTNQPIFVKVDGFYQIVPAVALSVGHYLIQVNDDGTFTEVLINSIEEVFKNTTVYQFNCEPADWFIAGTYLVHNK
jgi:hypothetical protein